MNGLGHKFDIGPGINVVADLAAGANTGNRFHLRNYETVAIVLNKGVASAGTDDVVITLQEHNANTGGTSQNLAVVTEYFYKRHATSLADIAWTRVTQSAGATVTLTGATYATLKAAVVFEVEAASLSDGFQWVSVNIADPGSGGTIPGAVLYVAHGLKVRRRPDLLVQPNA